MIRKLSLAASATLVLLAGCGGSGDIEINPSTVDNSVNNSNNTTTGGGTGGGGTTNPCASYVTDAGQTRQGTYDGTDCTYAPSFADSGNNITVDLTFTDLPNNGAHLFEGSLFIGESFDSTADMNAAGIFEGGDGPTLFIEAGATLAWQSSLDFLVINRGSQIFAVGRSDAPITLTSFSDVNGDLANDPEAVQQWGGVVIDGFGVTNRCEYTGNRGEAGFAVVGECDVPSEGSAGQDENFYGGDNDDDSSGRLEYVVVKHTGAEVGSGDELNGISFSGVGRGTTVENVQVYSTFDDGFEWFGGAVNGRNLVAVYARDDSLDIDEGYIGTIDTALVIQQEEDGNHCIESDGIGSYDDRDAAVRADFVARGLNSAPTIRNLTCIVSPNAAATATHDRGAGWRLREGIEPVIEDALVVSSFGVDSADDNYCLRVEDAETLEAFDTGEAEITPGVFACVDQINGGPTPGGTALDELPGTVFADLTGTTDPTATADTSLVLLEGTPPIFSVDYATSVVNDATPPGTPIDGAFVGALSQGATNPFVDWTFGIFDGNRSQPLWFE
jgi:hypothetical protein